MEINECSTIKYIYIVLDKGNYDLRKKLTWKENEAGEIVYENSDKLIDIFYSMNSDKSLEKKFQI